MLDSRTCSQILSSGFLHCSALLEKAYLIANSGVVGTVCQAPLCYSRTLGG